MSTLKINILNFKEREKDRPKPQRQTASLLFVSLMNPCEVSSGLGPTRSQQEDWGLQFHSENAKGSGSVGTEGSSDLESFSPLPRLRHPSSLWHGEA